MSEAVSLITTLAPETDTFGLVECRRVSEEWSGQLVGIGR